jgi:hypothetical protein
MNSSLLEKLESLGIMRALKMFPQKHGAKSLAGLTGTALGGPVGGLLGHGAVSGLDALTSLLVSQQNNMQSDTGYSPYQQLESPYGQDQQQNILQKLLQGGAQGLGNMAGNYLGQTGNNALLGQDGNSIQQILEMIPEQELIKYLESRQMNRGM